MGTDDAGAARGAVALGHLAEFLEHDGALTLLGAEDLLEFGDRGDEFVLLGDQFVVGERRQPAEPELEDPLGLLVAQRELVHEPFAGLTRIGRGADDRHHQIDVVDRDQQAFDDVGARWPLRSRNSDRLTTTSRR
ncbi:MAG: hypothetical protein R2710_15760 [Acidimicrobiales bacterium]